MPAPLLTMTLTDAPRAASPARHVVSTHQGTNATLVSDVARLYIADAARVADVTYGKGVFWRETDTRRFTLLGSDLEMGAYRQGQLGLFADTTPQWLAADFRQLPYRTACLDVVVLDPPYLHNPGDHLMNHRYRNKETTRGMYHGDILRELYCRGMQEAYRVLRLGGLLWVKGKDEIESGEQCWSHRELYDAALRCGFLAQDLFILHAQCTLTTLRWEQHRQLHARKNHSYLWIFTRGAGPLLPPRGRPKKGSVRTTINGQRGAAYLQARLLRDHPEVYACYQAGDFASVYAAARAAGLVKARARQRGIDQTPPTKGEDV